MLPTRNPQVFCGESTETGLSLPKHRVAQISGIAALTIWGPSSYALARNVGFATLAVFVRNFPEV